MQNQAINQQTENISTSYVRYQLNLKVYVLETAATNCPLCRGKVPTAQLRAWIIKLAQSTVECKSLANDLADKRRNDQTSYYPGKMNHDVAVNNKNQ